MGERRKKILEEEEKDRERGKKYVCINKILRKRERKKTCSSRTSSLIYLCSTHTHTQQKKKKRERELVLDGKGSRRSMLRNDHRHFRAELFYFLLRLCLFFFFSLSLSPLAYHLPLWYFEEIFIFSSVNTFSFDSASLLDPSARSFSDLHYFLLNRRRTGLNGRPYPHHQVGPIIQDFVL